VVALEIQLAGTTTARAGRGASRSTASNATTLPANVNRRSKAGPVATALLPREDEILRTLPILLRSV